MNMSQTIIIITAHPDDAELGMGMRIARHVKNGDKVILVVATGGEYTENSKSRYDENKKSSQILGITKEYFLTYTCGNLSSDITKFRTELEEIIRKENPDIAYTLFPNDIHIDHMVVSKQTKIAARSIPTLIYFRVVNSYNFMPNFYFFGDKSLFETKVKAIKCYKDEVKRKGAVNLKLIKLNSSSEYYHHFHHSSINKIRKNLGINDNDNLYCEMFYIERLSLL
ncbi:hypothetical protein CO178_00025 [candidate division WWE3 bacterium CG_4_9_14_3_um_filter_34_6]|uniref:PIG-L family deacetylase n=1 Tax=candidate division WWE3 bacterium CG_4_9_14_3_um_filter_34_6 TaxID=1975079 RepID=A0A2M7X5P9_UNCKA|nr:MAG: hypothetical protein CO178_00025 [candidate division WWE3 bacterium CG_4_9_14_3_um_filter_34_6]